MNEKSKFNSINYKLFIANELFTLTNIEVADRVKRETEFDTFFARELIFPDESVVIIPSTIGMSGEVHRKIGMQYGNNFG